jgi:hypothetical protein
VIPSSFGQPAFFCEDQKILHNVASVLDLRE